MKSKPLSLGKAKKNDDEISIGSCAHRIIDEQSKQISSLRSSVLSDAEPEPLHQMRIGTRKLRSALALFSDVVEVDIKGKKRGLSKLTNSLKKLTRTLGTVRDIDVMQQWFEQILSDYSSSSLQKKVRKVEEKTNKGNRTLSKSETKAIQALLEQLKERRKRAFFRLEDSLQGKKYKKLIRRCQRWVKQPAFTAAAHQPAYRGAVLKIIAPIIALVEHPGWLVATSQQINNQSIQTLPIAEITLTQINHQIAQQGEQLHDLRKQVKRVRYQTEFFREIYGTTYAAQIKEFRNMQKILGELQDQIVISEFLSDEIGLDWAEQLPTIEALFQDSRLDLWQQWQFYQRKYLELRDRLSTAE